MLNYMECAYRIVLATTAKCDRDGLTMKLPILLRMSTPLILADYSWLVKRGSADDQMRLWSISLDEDGFRSCTVLIFNARDGPALTTIL